MLFVQSHNKVLLQFVTCVKIQTTYRYVHKQIRNYIIEGHEISNNIAIWIFPEIHV